MLISQPLNHFKHVKVHSTSSFIVFSERVLKIIYDETETRHKNEITGKKMSFRINNSTVTDGLFNMHFNYYRQPELIYTNPTQIKIYTNDLDTEIKVYGCSITDQSEIRCLFNEEVTFGRYVFSSGSDYIECVSPQNIKGIKQVSVNVALNAKDYTQSDLQINLLYIPEQFQKVGENSIVIIAQNGSVLPDLQFHSVVKQTSQVKNQNIF